MKGTCENCAKKDTCVLTIGFMFGFCAFDFDSVVTKEIEDKIEDKIEEL